MQAVCRMRLDLSYNAVVWRCNARGAEVLEDVGREATRGEPAESRRALTAARELRARPLTLRRESRQRVVDDTRRDPALLEIVANERVAAASLGERGSA